jgi:hypothetical protein
VRDLTLILIGLYFDRDSLAAEAQVLRLTALETIAARGVVSASPDWRRWVCQEIQWPLPPAIPIAEITRHARAAPATPAVSGQWWIAQCIHLEAGVDRVYLSAEFPALSAGEWRELERGFNTAFSASGVHLSGGEGAQAYLESAAHFEIDTIDPARVAGADILTALPSGPAGVGLKRLMTEIQMWLHDHPVNIARQEREATTVNGLWIWGGGPWPLASPGGGLPELRSDDRFLRGVWNLGQARGESVPQSFQAIDAGRDAAIIVALGGVATAGENAAQHLSRLERDWFGPALSAVQRGRIGRLRLHVNDRLLSLTRAQAWRWWRRARPWFERLA